MRTPDILNELNCKKGENYKRAQWNHHLSLCDL